MATTTNPLDALLYIRNGLPTARWNFFDAGGTPATNPGGLGHSATLDYSFISSIPAYDTTGKSGFAAFTSVQQQAARDVLASISNMVNLTFNEVSGVGTMTFAMSAQGAGTGGFAYTPAFGYSTMNGNITNVTPNARSGDVWLNSSLTWTDGQFTPGEYGYHTLLHEIGHALGLKHSFADGNYQLDSSLESNKYTDMSYTTHPHSLFRTVTQQTNGGYNWTYHYIEPETLMPFDIEALQYVYGANTSYNATDTVYTFSPTAPFIKTIWDGGGIDTISISNFTLGSTINLQAGSYSSITIPSDPLPPGVNESNTNIYDGTDNLAIAKNVVIENAIGGSGNDTLLGNQVGNNLQGGAGNDSLSGAGGDDTLNGGSGNDSMSGGIGNDLYSVTNAGDSVLENAGEGIDTVLAAISYTLPANVEKLSLTGTTAINGFGNGLNNTLTGNAGPNSLSGGLGNDVINGGAGVDTLIGGSGNETYVVDNAGDSVVENVNEGTDLIQSTVSYTLPANVEKLTLTGTAAINGTGNDLANTLTGNAAANSLSGGLGNDNLNGAGGADTLAGGAGNDTYTADSLDTVIENVGEGVDLINSAISYTLPANVEKLTLTGTAAINGTGNNLANTLTGNAAANNLSSLSGSDLLDGGLGNDTLTGGGGIDNFRFTNLSSIDTLTDFVPGQDKIQLKSTVFTALGGVGALASGKFVAGASALDSDDFMLYNNSTGGLFYDADGNGGGTAVQIALLATKPALTYADFSVV